MQVGTTKDQGLYNKPQAAVHPGALAARTLPHNITCSEKINEKERKRDTLRVKNAVSDVCSTGTVCMKEVEVIMH